MAEEGPPTAEAAEHPTRNRLSTNGSLDTRDNPFPSPPVGAETIFIGLWLNVLFPVRIGTLLSILGRRFEQMVE